MKHSKAICTEVEGLLPLFVGGDLEHEDNTNVGQHIEECAGCALLFKRAELARRELRRGLSELVDGREPQLWPAIREELAREGLLRASGGQTPVLDMAERRSLVPGGEGERRPFTWRTLRVAGGLAASLTLVFLVGRSLDFGATERMPLQPAGSGGLAREAAPAAATGDLFADAGTLQPAEAAPSGLRPVGLGELPLFDQARDQNLRERSAASRGIFFPAQRAPSNTEGDLASSFSLQ